MKTKENFLTSALILEDGALRTHDQDYLPQVFEFFQFDFIKYNLFLILFFKSIFKHSFIKLLQNNFLI